MLRPSVLMRCMLVLQVKRLKQKTFLRFSKHFFVKMHFNPIVLPFFILEQLKYTLFKDYVL